MPSVPVQEDPPQHTRDPHVVVSPSNPRERAIWEYVSLRPIRSLWDMKGVSPLVVIKRTWCSTWDDDVFGWAAELGYWFLFALFPTLVSASSIIGITARHGSTNYARLLHYLGLVLPPSAFNMVLTNFTHIAQASDGKKIGLGLIAGIWAASAGFSAIQDAMNVVYKVKETRPYWKVKAISLVITPVLCLFVSGIFAALLAGDFLAVLAEHHIFHQFAATVLISIRIVGWLVAWFLLLVMFAFIYYWSPNVKKRQWRTLTPGAAVGTVGWLLASFGLRAYLHFFNTYNATYGSLGAVIILLTWFYITGLMLLFGGEFNSEIEAAAAEKLLAERGKIPEEAPAAVKAA